MSCSVESEAISDENSAVRRSKAEIRSCAAEVPSLGVTTEPMPRETRTLLQRPSTTFLKALGSLMARSARILRSRVDALFLQRAERAGVCRRQLAASGIDTQRSRPRGNRPSACDDGRARTATCDGQLLSLPSTAWSDRRESPWRACECDPGVALSCIHL